jgi:molecular chaperone GrpE
VADLENYRKRALRERQDTAKFATQSLMSGLLPVLDNLDAALAAASEQQGATLESMKMGVAMIRSQLLSALGAAGLVEIDAAGQPFDPNLHEALAQEECAETAEGHVLRQVRKGYKLHDRLLRPASVIVARKPAA